MAGLGLCLQHTLSQLGESRLAVRFWHIGTRGHLLIKPMCRQSQQFSKKES